MSLKVVFVDDELELCELFEELLATSEIHIKTFVDPLEAIDYISGNDVDVVFLDFRMPYLNGIECREKISSDIPCYLMTGESSLQVPETFRASFSKPFDIAEIEALLSNYLSKQSKLETG